MSFSIFGINIKISFLFIGFITLMIFSDRTGLILPLILAATVHELAHLVAMKILEVAPKEIILAPGNIHIIKPECTSLKKDTVILLAGPISNLFLFMVFYVFFSFFKNEILLQHAVVELVVAMFNLLPARGLDGGSLLLNGLLRIFSPTCACIIQKIISFCVGICFLVLSVFAIIKGNINISFLILGMYIIIFTIIKN